MRLAYLDPHPVPGQQPECLQILQTCDALAAVGVTVELVTPKSAIPTEQILGRPASGLLRFQPLTDWRQAWWMPKGSNRLFYRQVVAWLRRHPVDAILVRNLKLAEVLLKQPGLPPVFFETHEVFAQTYAEDHPNPSWSQRRKYRALQRRETFIYQRCQGVLALTQLLLEDIARIYPQVAPGLVVADGVDLALAQAARELNRPDFQQPPRLLYLGSLHPWKGVETLIRAMPRVQGAELWIAGGGSSRITELKALAASLQIVERVRFLGAIEPIKRFELIAETDICLLPLTQTSIGSRYTSPLKLFEYMAMAKPMVIADLPSIREVLVDGETALLAECESATSFADKINQLLVDPLLVQRLVQNTGQLVKAYSWQARAQKIRAFIEQQSQRLASTV